MNVSVRVRNIISHSIIINFHNIIYTRYFIIVRISIQDRLYDNIMQEVEIKYEHILH